MGSSLSVHPKGSGKNVLKSIAIVRNRVAGDSVGSKEEGSRSAGGDGISSMGSRENVSGDLLVGDLADGDKSGTIGRLGSEDSGGIKGKRSFKGVANVVRVGARLALGAK